MGRAAKLKQERKLNAPLKLDLGCGINKREGFIGIDAISFVGVDQVVDLTVAPWPWEDVSVSEVNASHFVEHLTPPQRILFVNELYRILVPDGTCQIVVPHWASCRAYGDLTHQWPPVSEFWFFYLAADWRAVNAPHNDGYKCHFEAFWAPNPHPALATKHQEAQAFALANYKEAILDLVVTLKKKPFPGKSD